MTDDDPLAGEITTRERALDILGALWDADVPEGARLVADVVAEMGYAAALTDEALIRLAHRQQGEDQRLALAAARRDAWR
jgi:hypothetical protein